MIYPVLFFLGILGVTGTGFVYSLYCSWESLEIKTFGNKELQFTLSQQKQILSKVEFSDYKSCVYL